MNTDNMTDEQLRVVIAKVCGKCACKTYKQPKGWESAVCDGCGKNPYEAAHNLPNYLGDLNEMAGAELMLNPPPMDRETDRANDSEEWKCYEHELAMACPMGTWIRATARQRALAFVKCLPESTEK